MPDVPPKPKIVLLVGLPGSGKSTCAAARGLPVISSDHVRELLADDPTDQTIHRRVFALMRHLLRQRLALRRPLTCVDATHLSAWERNRRRNRVVPEEGFSRVTVMKD